MSACRGCSSFGSLHDTTKVASPKPLTNSGCLLSSEGASMSPIGHVLIGFSFLRELLMESKRCAEY